MRTHPLLRSARSGLVLGIVAGIAFQVVLRLADAERSREPPSVP